MSVPDQSFLKKNPSPAVLEITAFEGNAQVIERLKELGLHPGLQLIYQSRMPFNGPKLIRFGATVLALREEEAACLRVK